MLRSFMLIMLGGTLAAPLLSSPSQAQTATEGQAAPDIVSVRGCSRLADAKDAQVLTFDESSLEADALERLAADGQLAAYRHEGFWQCMDTLRDKRLLESLWEGERAPWKTWE